MDTFPTFKILMLLFFVIMSAFFSASETAITCCNKVRLKLLADEDNKKAKRALNISEDFEKTLTTILIGNNIVNIAAASVATVIATIYLKESGVAIATGVTTLVILTFGEVLPKSYAKQNADNIAIKYSGILYFFIKVLSPLSFIFVKLQNVTLSKNEIDSPTMTEEELMSIIETGQEEGVIDKQRSELMQAALEFDETTVSDVLTPRVDMVAINIEDSNEKILKKILEERYTRIPVYEKTTDNILGILNTRDYLEELIKNPKPDIRKMLTVPLFVHKTQLISKLLSRFRKDRIHIAVVLDDFGGTMGIVTLEDMVEEIVGEIYDEDEVIDVSFVKTGKNSWKISGDYSVDEAMQVIGVDERDFESEYSSFGGWAMEQFGRVPEVNDSFEFMNYKITVFEMDEQRIVWLKIKKIEKRKEE